MTIQYYPEIEQGTQAWHDLRGGILTASRMKQIITPKTLKPVNKGEVSDLHWELLAQRITKYVEPSFDGYHMQRGKLDELDASILYDKTYANLERTGFVTNDKWGFIIGFSPDGLVVGKKKFVEFKSRLQKFQVQTIIEDKMPDDFRIQVNTGMLVTEIEVCDFGSYCGGMPMFTKEITPDPEVQGAIIEAATLFEKKMAELMAAYLDKVNSGKLRLLPTVRRVEEPLPVGTFE